MSFFISERSLGVHSGIQKLFLEKQTSLEYGVTILFICNTVATSCIELFYFVTEILFLILWIAP